MTTNPVSLPGWFRRQPDDDAQPDAEGGSEETTAGATTGGGKDDQTPVVVWEAANRMEAEIVAGRLHSEGIPAIIQGEALGAIYGLTTGSLAAATVLVPAALAEKAIAILSTEVVWDEAENADSSGNEAPDVSTDVGPNQERDG
jgi:hypothetical protein